MYLGKNGPEMPVSLSWCVATTTTGVNRPSSTCAFAIWQGAIKTEVVSHHSSVLTKAHNGCMKPKGGPRGSETYIIGDQLYIFLYRKYQNKIGLFLNINFDAWDLSP